MSVFSLDVAEGNPVTQDDLQDACNALGVSIKDSEKEEYLNLLAIYHDSMVKLMSMEDYIPEVDEHRFPREDVHFASAEENPYGAWTWKCSISDKSDAPDGLLKGTTVAVKDCIAIKGVPMLLGTDFIKDYTPNTDAVVVTRLLESGARILGKGTCENLCHSATSHTASTGVVHNPYVRGYSSGGSSSGPGVLVALGPEQGGCDCGIGADQGGSVRVPVAWCGIVGMKPTFGLVPWTGCGSNEPTNDHLGPMTRDVASNARLLKAIAGTDFVDDRSYGAPPPEKVPSYHEKLESLSNAKDLTGYRIGIITESLKTPALDPRVKDCFLKAAERFRSLGAIVEEISIPMHSSASTIWTGISKLGGYLNKTLALGGRRGYHLNDLGEKFWPLTQESWNSAIPSTKNIYLNGAYAQDLRKFPGLIGKASNLSLKARHAYDAALGDWSSISTFIPESKLTELKKTQHTYDVLISPTVPYIASSHPELGPDGVTGQPILQLQKQVGLTGNTAPFNQSGHPALAMPIGMLKVIEGPAKGTGKKLPVSMQIVGKWWAEEMVYRVGYAWEVGVGGPEAWKSM